MRDGARKWKGPDRAFSTATFGRQKTQDIAHLREWGCSESSCEDRSGTSLYGAGQPSSSRGIPPIRSKRTLRTEELARDVEGFTSHNDDLLAIQHLLGDGAGQATKKVSLAVDDDL